MLGNPVCFVNATAVTVILLTISTGGSESFVPPSLKRGYVNVASSRLFAGDVDISLWNGEDESSFQSLSHPGYTTIPDPDTQLGGWVAHRIPKTVTANLTNQTDWIDDVAPLITKFDYATLPIKRPPRILILYGSLRQSSYSRHLAYEFARLLEGPLNCDIRIYHSHNLPVRNPDIPLPPKAAELRALSEWSDGQVWVSPEMHGTITGVFKNQIDWLPLNSGSVRPTQGRTCCVAQVNGGSQSFNAVNALRLLARWMRMPCCTNQSSVPKAWMEFVDDGDGGMPRMRESSLRDRVVDVAEEFAKFTAVMVPVANDLNNRYSERKEKEKEGRLLTQAEKETS